MAGVFIDIPGVGNVEAKNAATEATLKELLKAMQGVQKNTGGGGGGAPSGGSGGGGAATKEDGKAPGLLGKAANAAGQAMGKLSAKVMPVIGGFQTLNTFLTGTISKFADVGDSVERAAGTIPILGGLFTAVAGAAVKVNDSFINASKSGATFGGSVNNMAAAASSAGMTMDKFGALVSRNGTGMLGFGATTEEGAKRFAQVSKTLRQTSGDLYALGYSTEDINQGLASYGDLLRKQGLQGNKSNTELVAGAQKYMKELDAMAKITGEERSVKESQMKALAQDAQFQAAMAGKSEGVRASFMKTVGSLPAPLQGFVKDFLATGTLTSEETQRIGAMMGGDVMNELQSMRNKMQAGQELTAAEQDRLASIMKAAGEKQLKANGSALAASREMDGATNAMVAATQLQTGAHKKTAEEQAKAAKEGDGFNKKMQQMQQAIAQVSNAFQMVLANSGLLDLMFKMFQGLAALVTNIVVPAFNIFAGIVSTVANFLMSTITPVFNTLGAVIKDWIYPAFLTLAAFVVTDIVPMFQSMGQMINEYVVPAFQYIGQIIGEYVTPVFSTIADFISTNLTPIMYGLMAAFGAYYGLIAVSNGLELIRNGITLLANVNLGALALAALTAAAPFLAIAIPVIALIAIFKNLYDKGWSLGTAMEGIKDTMYKVFVLGFKELLIKILSFLPQKLGGYSAEEEKAAKEGLASEYKELEDREKARDAKREVLAAERAAGKDVKARDLEKKKIDEKLMGHTKKVGDGIGKTADKVADANKTIDSNAGPEALLKQFSAKEGGTVELGIKKDEAGKEKSAADKELAEAKTTAEKKAAIAKIEEAEKKIASLDAALKLSKAESNKKAEATPVTPKADPNKKAEATPIAPKAESSKKADVTKKELEAKGEEKTAAEKKAQQEADAKKSADEKAKENEEKKQPQTQESAESLLAQLNSNMAQLVKISQDQKDIGERQLNVQRSLTGDLFASV